MPNIVKHLLVVLLFTKKDKNMETNQMKELNKITYGAKIIANCTGLNHEGEGICKITGIKDGQEIENYVLFVNNMLPGEKGQIEIGKIHKSYGYANLLKVFSDKKSPNRVVPFCKHYESCGGCNIMHLDYKAQLEFKKDMIVETLKKIGGFSNPIVNTVLGMQNPNYYRNKVQVPFRELNFKVNCGFFAKESHHIIPIDECLIQPQLTTDIIKFIRNICNEFKIEGYNETNHSGLIRHVLIRTNHTLDEIMIVLVLTKAILNDKEKLIHKIINRYKNVKSIIINVNDKLGNTILGDKCITIYGNDYITDELCGLKFRIDAKSFYQINHTQTEVLYNKIIEIGKFNTEDVIIDAYCGIGTIGLIASKYAKEVLAVEIVEEAIYNAKINAKNNNITNVTFECNKAEEQIIKWANENKKIDAIIVDPPRKGCDQKLLNTIDLMKIPKIIYISCNPSTLARDLKILVEKDYDIIQIQPIDMFPYTSNVECVVCLKRR